MIPIFKIYEFKSKGQQQAMDLSCNYFGPVCYGIAQLLNFTSPYNDPDRAEVMGDRVQSGGSIKQLLHYAQIMQSGVFKQYDYGSDSKNIEHYGSKTIPIIPLESIKKVPIAMYVGKEDDLGDLIDNNNVR